MLSNHIPPVWMYMTLPLLGSQPFLVTSNTAANRIANEVNLYLKGEPYHHLTYSHSLGHLGHRAKQSI